MRNALLTLPIKSTTGIFLLLLLLNVLSVSKRSVSNTELAKGISACRLLGLSKWMPLCVCVCKTKLVTLYAALNVCLFAPGPETSCLLDPNIPLRNGLIAIEPGQIICSRPSHSIFYELCVIIIIFFHMINRLSSFI